MAFLKTNHVNITVNGTTYNSLSDFGLAIQNTDYVGMPVQDKSHRVYVPGRPGPLDLDETVFGGTSFLYRPISIHFGGMRETETWDSVISTLRHLFEGKNVKLTFATDPDYYWTGKAEIDRFGHQRQLGEFDFNIPEAFPYKYKVAETSYDVVAAYNGRIVTCENAMLDVVPTFQSTGTVTVTYGDVTHQITSGQQLSWKDIVFHEGENEIILTGSGTVTITYREGVL